MSDLEQVQIQIETAEKIRKLRDNCVKLMDNKYFKDVIEEAYFKEEAARLVMAKSAPLPEASLQVIDHMQYGIGALKNFLQELLRRGSEMDQAIGEQEETREEILAEEVAV